MENIIDVASRIERKLQDQITEINRIRDKALIVAAFGLTASSTFFTLLEGLVHIYKGIMIGSILISLIGVFILIYVGVQYKLNRGLTSKKLEDLIEKRDLNSFFENDIAANLRSFNDNLVFLNSARKLLNIGIQTQGIVVLIMGLVFYLNQIFNV